MNALSAQPDISVLIPIYNGELYLNDAVRSCLKQSFANAEFLLIDDGSTDSSLDIALQLAHEDDRIRVLRHEDRQNHGPAISRNLGLASARGTYVTFLDCDDRWESQRLELFYGYMQQTEGKFAVHSNAWLCDVVGNILPGDFQSRFNRKNAPMEGNLFSALCLRNFINISSCMVRTELLRQVGGFRDVPPLEDWDAWIRLSRVCEFRYLDQCLTYYRISQNSLSGTNNAGSMARSRDAVYKLTLRDYPLPGRIASMVHYLRGCNLNVLGEQEKAKKEFALAWRTNPFNWRAVWKYLSAG